jgi:glycosyltransferase involved in cell wall biosynthesis
VRKKYDLPEQYYLYVGNIEPRKNLSVLLDGYKLYSDSVKEPFPLLLVGGDGWNNEEIKRKINRMQVEHYKVRQPAAYVLDADLPALYGGALALVYIPLHEGFGLPPVQAQACGTPVVVSDLSVFHEILRPVGTTYIKDPTARKVAHVLIKKEVRPHSGYAPLTWGKTVAELLAAIKQRG